MSVFIERTHAQLVASVKQVLDQYDVSMSQFVESDLDDYQEPDLRELWLLYHETISKGEQE